MSVEAPTTEVCCLPVATLFVCFRCRFGEKKKKKCRIRVDRAGCWRCGYFCGKLERYAGGIRSEAWAYRQSAGLIDRAGRKSVDEATTTASEVDFKALNFFVPTGEWKKRRHHHRCWKYMRMEDRRIHNAKYIPGEFRPTSYLSPLRTQPTAFYHPHHARSPVMDNHRMVSKRK